jgi:hypothetical protein
MTRLQQAQRPATSCAASVSPRRTGSPTPPDPGESREIPADPKKWLRARADRVYAAGTVTLRTSGRLHHIGVGRTYAGTSILLIIQDLNIRIINAATGELLRELTLDPARDYQPTRAPKGPARKPPAKAP